MPRLLITLSFAVNFIMRLNRYVIMNIIILKDGVTTTIKVSNIKQLHQLLTEVYLLDIDIAISEFFIS